MEPLQIRGDQETWFTDRDPRSGGFEFEPADDPDMRPVGEPTGRRAPWPPGPPPGQWPPGPRPAPWPPGPRPGPWPPGRRPGPWPQARQDYLDETASPWGGGRRPEVTGAGTPGIWLEPDQRRGSRGADGMRRREDSASAASILLAADYQAAAIMQLASFQAAMITQQVAYEAADIRAAAGREAGQLMQRAAVQASAVRETAEMEAAEMRQAVMMMRTELSDLATRITSTLPGPVLPRTPQPSARERVAPGKRPPSRHAARRAKKAMPRPDRQPMAQPAKRPVTPPARKPAAQPAKTAIGRGRQAGAMRVAVVASSALLLFAAAAGVTEIFLHGFAFFVFRSVGTGETGRGPGGLTEDQGPGQPDAPKPTPSHAPTQSHVKTQSIRRHAVTVHNG